MGEFISYAARPIVAKGLDSNAVLDYAAVDQYLFSDEKCYLKSLENVRISLPVRKPLIFYPGCGVDIVWFLHVVKRVFDVFEMNVLFMDQDYVQGIIETILDDIGVSFDRQGNILHFYFQGILVHLTIQNGNVFDVLENVPMYDVYFERAFRLMRDAVFGYERWVFEKLRLGGVLISDCGYGDVGLERIPVNAEISVYGEMIVGKKK